LSQLGQRPIPLLALDCFGDILPLFWKQTSKPCINLNAGLSVLDEILFQNLEVDEEEEEDDESEASARGQAAARVGILMLALEVRAIPLA